MADGNKDETDQARIDEAMEDLRDFDAPLSTADKVLVMQGWNKVLAFSTAFSEALLVQWRILIAAAMDSSTDPMHSVETHQDPLALALGDRMYDVEELTMGLLDGAIRSLCPHTQVVARESYRPIADDTHLTRAKEGNLSLECETVSDYLDLFSRCGVQPQCWVLFCHAFAWAVETHTPYAQDDDIDDLQQGPAESAFFRAVAQTVAKPAVKAYSDLKALGDNELYSNIVPQVWQRLGADDRITFGQTFYRRLLGDYPDVLDYFSKTDMDSLAIHFSMALDLLFGSVKDLGTVDTQLRKTLNHLGEIHRVMGVPTYSYALVGQMLVTCLEPHLVAEAERLKKEHGEDTYKLGDLRKVCLRLYSEVMSVVYYPMLRQEKKIRVATEYMEQMKAEFEWSDGTFQNRMTEVEQEIAGTGTYTHTSEELEMGARLAWRNSAKCIGRISWNTLQVRDCRHLNTPEEIFEDVHEHLRIATAGTNIQSVMTVFKPRSEKEAFGVRFWTSQYVRYAGYKDEETGKILGDPANLEITEWLLEKNYWTPPEPKTRFDVLPLVVKVPGRKKPYIHQLPAECVFEVPIEHPTRPEITALGYRWGTVPAISDFKMDLGGVWYQNMPFNGWFLSTEIVRNLMERYDAGPEVAKAIGLDTNVDPMWRQHVAIELERSIMYSFQKNGFTIVDPHSVGESFCVHVRREREQFGRECPGQWSWIGGLTGPTNATWHLEMRDFLVLPQYAYAADGRALHTSKLHKKIMGDDTATMTTVASSDNFSITSDISTVTVSTARVLIVYGSETGNSEAVARRLKRQLKLLKPILMNLNEAAGLEVVRKRSITHVICICSTFGKGEAPSNAANFFEKDIKIASENLKFAVLALGSTLYPDFCQAGSRLDRKLFDAGVDRMCTLTKADDASGADQVIADWLKLIKNLLLPPSMERKLVEQLELFSSEPAINVFKWTGAEATPLASPSYNQGSICVSNTELLGNHPDVSKSIRKITFQVPEGQAYESGDHLAVQPLNSEGMVKRFLACFDTELLGYARAAEGFPHPADCSKETCLDWVSKQMFELDCVEGDARLPADTFFKTPTTLVDVVTTQVDLNLSANNLVDLLKLLKGFIEQLKQEELDAMLSDPVCAEFITLIEPILQASGDKRNSLIDTFLASFPTIVNLFEHFKDVVESLVKLPEILVMLPKLQPRFYSISSSNRVSPREVSISVGVLQGKTSTGKDFEGVCSNYLARLRGGIDKADVGIRTSTFRLPSDLDCSLLMVGAGTGLAPMMGFLEDRAIDVKGGHQCGPIHLFFGCRTENDVIYESLINEYKTSGMIDYHLALSRSAGTPKMYVQDRVSELGKQACDLLLDPKTHYYVCGDARMADSCYEACIGILREHGVMSRVSAVQHLKKMRMQGRWQTDVWGIVSHFGVAKKEVEQRKKMSAKIWLSMFTSDDE